jgi:hypothetical protein
MFEKFGKRFCEVRSLLAIGLGHRPVMMALLLPPSLEKTSILCFLLTRTYLVTKFLFGDRIICFAVIRSDARSSPDQLANDSVIARTAGYWPREPNDCFAILGRSLLKVKRFIGLGISIIIASDFCHGWATPCPNKVQSAQQQQGLFNRRPQAGRLYLQSTRRTQRSPFVIRHSSFVICH